MNAKDMKISEFVDDLASCKSAPGGGSAAALQGAIGAGLIAMVCSLTLRSNDPAEHIELNKNALEQAQQCKEQFLKFIDNDMTEVNHYFRDVMTLPKSTEQEKAVRREAMQQAFKDLATPPVHIIECCYECTKILQNVYGKSYPMAQSDLGCAASNLMAAADCAWINVKVNTTWIKDKAYASNLENSCQKKLSYIKNTCSNLYTRTL